MKALNDMYSGFCGQKDKGLVLLWGRSNVHFSLFSRFGYCTLSLVFYKAQKSNSGFELFSLLIIVLWFSNLELGFSNLGFKTWVFNSQFLTQTDISFARFPNFKPEKGHFLVYFNMPNMSLIKISKCLRFQGDLLQK